MQELVLYAKVGKLEKDRVENINHQIIWILIKLLNPRGAIVTLLSDHTKKEYPL